MGEPDFTVSDWPPIRNLVDLTFRHTKPCTVHGHAEFDVTRLLERLAALKDDPHAAVSLNTYLVYVLSRVAARHPELRTYRHGRRRVVFAHADVLLPILKTLPDGTTVPALYIVREADTKSLAVINGELKRAIRQRDLTDSKAVRFRRALLRAPSWVQGLVYRWMFASPMRMKRYFGNIGLTSLRYLGSTVPMVGLPPNVYSLQLSIGGVTERFVPDENRQPVLRSMLLVGSGFDHLVMDGMTMAATVKDFGQIVADAQGLDEAYVRACAEGAADGDP